MDNILKWLGFGIQCLSILIIPFGRACFDKFDREDMKNQKNTEKLRGDFDELKKEIADNYLRRDEYLTVSGNLISKMDEITKVVYEIKGELKNKKF